MKLRATRGNVLLKVYLNQKSAYSINVNGKNVDLYIGSELRENYRERNPVVAEIIDNATDYDYLKKGDNIIVHHNMCSEPKTNPRCIEYDPQSGVAFFSVPGRSENILCRIDKDGKPSPICGNLLVDRIFDEVKSKLIIIPDHLKKQKVATVMKITAVAPEIKDLKRGQKIAVHEFSDYEMVYSWNKKEYSAIKVNREFDVLDVIVS